MTNLELLRYAMIGVSSNLETAKKCLGEDHPGLFAVKRHYYIIEGAINDLTENPDRIVDILSDRSESE